MDLDLLSNIFYAMVRTGTPLLLVALGELICEKSGVLNLGQEGMMLFGAVIGFIVALSTGNLWLGVLLAMSAGMLLSLPWASGFEEATGQPLPLAQLRTGSHWLGEETGRWARVPREQRLCPHCQGGVEGVHHVLFECPLYASARDRFPDLFSPGAQPEVASFLQQRPGLLSAFVSECHRRHVVAAAAAAGSEAAPAPGPA